MPKLKTHRGAAKRFRKMASGAIKRDARVEARTLKPCDARLAKRMLHGS